MEDRLRELDVPKVARTILRHLATRPTLRAAIDGTEFGIVQTLLARCVALLIHRLRVLDVADGHVLDLLWREQAELDLLHILDGRAGEGEDVVPAVDVATHLEEVTALPRSEDVGMFYGFVALYRYRFGIGDARCLARHCCLTSRLPPTHDLLSAARPLRGPPPLRTPSLPLLHALFHRCFTFGDSR